MKGILSRKWINVHLNTLDPFVPEVWAQESLMILEANMVTANLVHRDFSNEVAKYGDIVNTRRPAEFVAARKVDGDDVTVQNAVATNVPVALDQHIHTSFIIYDGEESKGFKSLRDEYLVPALLSQAQIIDEILNVQAYQFIGNVEGSLGTAVAKATLLDLKELMSTNKVPVAGRNLIVTPASEGDFLAISEFTNAEKIGDAGTTMREGSLGRKFGFNTFMSQNAPSIATGNTIAGGAVDNGAGYPIGTTTLTCDTFSAAVTPGGFVVIAGDDIPQKVTGSTGTPCTEIVISPGLKRAVADNAVVTSYTPGAVDLGAGYASGWNKEIVVDAFSVAPKIGQLVTFGTAADAAKHGLLTTPTTTALLLGRSLEATAADNAIVGIGPAGNYNFAFVKNALALVTRPLALPKAGTGAQSFVANYRGLAIRVTIAYDPYKQGHLVTVDMLAGVKVLDARLGAVLLG